MPNWCEGTVKIRGKLENVKRFLLEGLNHYSYRDFDNPVPKEDWMVINDNKKYGYYEIDFDVEAYVEGTRRAFVSSENACHVFYWEDNHNGTPVAVMHVRQAWRFREEEWCEISKKYDVDIRLYGVEQGMMFTEDIEIIKGEVTKNESHVYETYEQWVWNCPFPNYGG